jgi:xanthosine utilization system XapX-like protein
MKLFQFISGFFRQGTRESSTRLVMLSWGLGVLAVWCHVSVNKTELVPIPETVLVLVLGLLGIKAGEKVATLGKAEGGTTAGDK